MRARWIYAVVLLVLLACLICPLVETDPDDNVFQTGNDTESALAVLALCVAATCALARAITVIYGHFFLSCRALACCVVRSPLFAISAAGWLFVASASPPIAALRI
jgi:hypothetical protein